MAFPLTDRGSLAAATLFVMMAAASGCAAGPAGGAAVEAELFAPGVISDDRWQYRISFSADGDTAYFTVADEFFPASRRSVIVVSTRAANGEWTAPRTASFSGTHTDIDPFITRDGSRLYFSSIRPLDGVARDALDIFYVERHAGGWGEPIRLVLADQHRPG